MSEQSDCLKCRELTKDLVAAMQREEKLRERVEYLEAEILLKIGFPDAIEDRNTR